MASMNGMGGMGINGGMGKAGNNGDDNRDGKKKKIEIWKVWDDINHKGTVVPYATIAGTSWMLGVTALEKLGLKKKELDDCVIALQSIDKSLQGFRSSMDAAVAAFESAASQSKKRR